jgi:hypothetical protein
MVSYRKAGAVAKFTDALVLQDISHRLWGMTAHKFDLFLPIFLSPFIPLWATVTRPMLCILAKAVNYQTQAKRMAGRPEENLEKCAGGGDGFKRYGEAVSRFFFLGSPHSCEISYNCESEGSYLLLNNPCLLLVQGHTKTDQLLTPYFVTACFNIIPPSISEVYQVVSFLSNFY